MTDRARRSAADVLLELLGKVPDAATLEILLEPEHLRSLLRAQGVSDEAIRRDLGAGRTPGELLLGVLAREPDTAVLLRLLGDPAPTAPRKKASPVAPASPAASRAGAKPLTATIAGALLAIPSGYYLFVRLDFLHVPGLARYFPGAYSLLGTGLIAGLFLLGKGLRGLLRGKA